MTLPDLRFAGFVIVGKCPKCTLYIWGSEGTKKDEHSYCGVRVRSTV